MEAFWICFGFLGLMFVPAILMFLFCGCTWGNKIGGAIVCLLFWLAICGVMYAEDKWDNEMWNNGICSMCEGEYNFSGATKYRTSHHYYYTCENCDHTIELNSLMK
jgi:hypothetical protein